MIQFFSNRTQMLSPGNAIVSLYLLSLKPTKSTGKSPNTNIVIFSFLYRFL